VPPVMRLTCPPRSSFQGGAVPLLLSAVSPSSPVPLATAAVVALAAVTVRREVRRAALASGPRAM
jgi:hypothetical protein